MEGGFDKDATQAAMVAALCKQRRDGLFTDVTVTHGPSGKLFKAHKNVLCGMSEWFVKACTGGFKEAKDAMITLYGDDENAVSAMIDFCYRFEYSEPSDLSMTFHVAMFAMGEKYMIPALQSLAGSRFKESMATKWSVKDFTTAVRAIYEDTTDSHRALRSAAVKASAEHYIELFRRREDTSFIMVFIHLQDYMFDVVAAQLEEARTSFEAAEI